MREDRKKEKKRIIENAVGEKKSRYKYLLNVNKKKEQDN